MDEPPFDMTDNDHVFPDSWPDGCPPADAFPAGGVAYACHRTNPASPLDFRSAAERGLYSGRDECQRNGISLSTDIDDARYIARLFPRLRFISKGELKAKHGKLKRTKGPVQSHHTLWCCVNVELTAIFDEVVHPNESDS